MLRDVKLIILISVPEDYTVYLLHVSLVKVTPGSHGKEIIYTKGVGAENLQPLHDKYIRFEEIIYGKK